MQRIANGAITSRGESRAKHRSESGGDRFDTPLLPAN
jgi:hypothetical protein